MLGLGCHRSQGPPVAGREAEAPGRARSADVHAKAMASLPWRSGRRAIKARLPAEALSKSDCDLFGLVTIKVWEDSYLSDAGL